MTKQMTDLAFQSTDYGTVCKVKGYIMGSLPKGRWKLSIVEDYRGVDKLYYELVVTGTKTHIALAHAVVSGYFAGKLA